MSLQAKVEESVDEETQLRGGPRRSAPRATGNGRRPAWGPRTPAVRELGPRHVPRPSVQRTQCKGSWGQARPVGK
eukprot:14039025-Alexandrium_andersonii.AAC.1